MKRKLALALMLVMMLVMLVPWQALAQSTVDSGISGFAYSFQRKSFYSQGLEWVFYWKGSYLYFKTGNTTGGTTIWSNATAVCISSSDDFSIFFDGTYIHYVRGGYGDEVSYRRGIPYGGNASIAWQSAVTINMYLSGTASQVSVSVNTSGYPFINCYENGGLFMFKGTLNDGTFGSKDGGTHLFGGSYTVGFMMQLASDKMAYIAGKTGAPLAMEYWDGAWHTAVTGTSNIQADAYYSAVANGDDVSIVFLKKTTYDIIYTSYSETTNTFGAETTIYGNATSTSAPVLSRDSTTNNLWVYWQNSPTVNHNYLAVYRASEGTWYSYYDLGFDSDGLTVPYFNADYTVPTTNLGLFYDATGVLKFKYLAEQFVVDTLTPNGITLGGAALWGNIVSIGWGSPVERGFYLTSNAGDTTIPPGNITGALQWYPQYYPIGYGTGTFSQSVGSLSLGVTYYYVAYASNAEVIYGNWTSFSTSVPIVTPSGNLTGDTATICSTTVYNFLAVPMSNTDVKLTWDWYPAGNSSVQIDIYYSLYQYPATRADGTLIYQGTSDVYTHTSLSPGTTYYYRAWLLCGGNYSADYVEDWATTYGSAPVVSPPEQPGGWFQDPSCTAYGKIPLLSDALTALNSGYGFPMATICVMFTLLWIIVLGLVVFLFIHSAMMMVIAIAVLIILTSIMGLLPLWMIVIAICLGGISIYISSRT